MKNPPAFQFYPNDFIAERKVASMTLEERGMYITLLCYCWQDGELPDDMGELADLCGTTEKKFSVAWERRISRCFEKTQSGSWVNPRMRKEMEKQEEYRQKQAEYGKKGAKRRWGDEGESTVQEKGCPSDGIGYPISDEWGSDGSSSSSSSSSSDSNSGEAIASSSPEGDAAAQAESIDPDDPLTWPYPMWKQAVVDDWNSRASPPFQTVKKLTDEREKHLRTRYGDRQFRVEFRSVFKTVTASEFCRGGGPRGWVASFDWIIKNNGNYVKVLEGKYGQFRHSNGKANGRTAAPNPAEYVELAAELGI